MNDMNYEIKLKKMAMQNDNEACDLLDRQVALLVDLDSNCYDHFIKKII